MVPVLVERSFVSEVPEDNFVVDGRKMEAAVEEKRPLGVLVMDGKALVVLVMDGKAPGVLIPKRLGVLVEGKRLGAKALVLLLEDVCFVKDKPLALASVEDGTKGTKLKFGKALGVLIFIDGKALSVSAFVDSKALSVPAFAEDGIRLGLLVEGKSLAGGETAARLELPKDI
jgi:hypothetical protein